MRKKIVMTVASLAMAAVVGVSAFAADAVPSITGADGNTTFTPASTTVVADEEKTASQKAYEVLTSKNEDGSEISLEEKLNTIAGENNTVVAEIAQDVATQAGETVSVNDMTVRAVGDITASDEGVASLTVKGVNEDTVVVVMYQDENGNWQKAEVVYVNGVLQIKFGKKTKKNVPIVLMTYQKTAVAV